MLGTSLQVQPFSKLIDKVDAKDLFFGRSIDQKKTKKKQVPSVVPRLLINRQEVGKQPDGPDGKRGGFRFGT